MGKAWGLGPPLAGCEASCWAHQRRARCFFRSGPGDACVEGPASREILLSSNCVRIHCIPETRDNEKRSRSTDCLPKLQLAHADLLLPEQRVRVLLIKQDLQIDD